MPHYVFRRDFIQPKDAKQRTLVDNLSRALKDVRGLAPHLTYDLSTAVVDIDAGGERIEMKVGESSDIGWHLTHADTLANYGVMATRFQSK